MSKDPSRKSRDLTPRERREELQRFSPADAAFVLHLAECDRCRGHAGKLLEPGAEAAGDGPGLSSDERDIMLHLTRGAYLLSLRDEAPQADLPRSELQRFVQSLAPGQAAFIGHLLGCERCRQAVAKALKPPAVPPARTVLAELG